MSPSRRRQRQQPIFYLFYVNCFQDLGEDFAISWRNLSEKTEKKKTKICLAAAGSGTQFL